MLDFNDTAKAQLNNLIEGNDSNAMGIRVLPKKGGELEVSLVELNKLQAGEEPLRDRITHFFVEYEGYMVIVNPEGQKVLGNAQVIFEDGGALSGHFSYQTPEAIPDKVYHGPDLSDPTVQKVSDLLDQEINPGLAMHGGRAELLNVLDNKVYLRFGGGCQGCSMIDATVKQGIETRIKEAIPQITGVVDETDHGAGTNPFFN